MASDLPACSQKRWRLGRRAGSLRSLSSSASLFHLLIAAGTSAKQSTSQIPVISLLGPAEPVSEELACQLVAPFLVENCIWAIQLESPWGGRCEPGGQLHGWGARGCVKRLGRGNAGSVLEAERSVRQSRAQIQYHWNLEGSRIQRRETRWPALSYYLSCQPNKPRGVGCGFSLFAAGSRVATRPVPSRNRVRDRSLPGSKWPTASGPSCHARSMEFKAPTADSTCPILDSVGATSQAAKPWTSLRCW